MGGTADAREVTTSRPVKGSGVRLYSPATVGAYSVFGGLPMGCLLYGINSARRGARIMGTIMYLLAGASCIFMTFAAALGGSISIYGLLGILGGIGFYNLESEPFRAAVLKGATRARWWPPLVFLVGTYLVVAMMVVALGIRVSK